MASQKAQTQEEVQKAWGKVLAKAWSDEAFKKRLLADPAGVLKENGIEMPPDVTVKVVEDSAKVLHLILPEPPGDLSLEELEKVAGGATPIQLPKILPRAKI